MNLSELTLLNVLGMFDYRVIQPFQFMLQLYRTDLPGKRKTLVIGSQTSNALF
jgi:hypothetical protein